MQLSRISLAINRVGASGPFAGSALNLDFTSGNNTLDSRITFTRASAATRTNASGVLETVAIDGPRFDYDPVTLQPKGLLIEEQRTNSIRNNTMQGAVAGTPGTAPTNWAFGALAGLTSSVVGTGTEGGITYVDVRLNGTTTGTGATLRLESLNQQAASSGQTWTGSSYLRLVGGSITNVTSLQLTIFGRDSTNTSETESFSSSDVKGSISGALAAQRTAVTGTLANASTAFICERVSFSLANSAAIDITLRIGLPQLEQGAFATSVIPTTTAAATRAADVAVMQGTNFSSWYNQTEGTLFADCDTAPSGGTAQRRIVYAGVSTDRFDLRLAIDGLSTGFNVVSGGITQAAITGAGATASTKIVGAYKANDFSAATNGVLGTSDTSGSIPTISQIAFGSNGSSESLNGHIRRIAYFPRRLSNAELQAITS